MTVESLFLYQLTRVPRLYSGVSVVLFKNARFDRLLSTQYRRMKPILQLIVKTVLLLLLAGSAWADNSRFLFFESTVKDKHSGLTWTRDAHLGKCDWDGAFEFVNELNRSKFAGYNDWRLPDKEQLLILSSYAHSLGCTGMEGAHTPAALFNQIGFHKVVEDCYWSSSGDAFEIKFAWCVYMGDGTLCNPNKYEKLYIWPVRGGQ
jgi:hypothetical protein